MVMWISRNILEVREDPVLRAYGAFLAVTHVLTFIFWSFGGVSLIDILTSPEPVCWPFWAECFQYRFLSPDGVYWFLRAYLVMSLVSVLLFAKRSWATAAWWVFLALNLVKLLVVAQDFQLRLNQHYMAGVAAIAFLFLPGKRKLLKILIALFYFWAGLLKINQEWISGAALYRPIWLFTGAWIPVACTYVIVLEIVFVWGLFSRKTWVWGATLAQLILFHIFSWPVVGFFYPTLMFALLAIYVLDRWGEGQNVADRMRWPSYLFLGVFSAAQLVPYMMPGDSALTGEGRMFGVHMFDALIQCEATALLRKSDGTTAKRDLYRPMAPRTHCDPIVYWNRANALCRSNEKGRDFSDFDLLLRSRKTSQGQMAVVIDLKNYCASSPAYRVWRHNEWIFSK